MKLNVPASYENKDVYVDIEIPEFPFYIDYHINHSIIKLAEDLSTCELIVDDETIIIFVKDKFFIFADIINSNLDIQKENKDKFDNALLIIKNMVDKNIDEN
jgi:hypothetical protein